MSKIKIKKHGLRWDGPGKVEGDSLHEFTRIDGGEVLGYLLGLGRGRG